MDAMPQPGATNMKHLSILAAVFAFSTANAAIAEETILTVQATDLAEHVFDLAALDALPQQSFQTSTVWTDGVQEFSGPSLKTVLDHLDITGTTIEARALNDYVIEIPFDSLEADAPLIVTRINGEEFSRREKGPLWIVYPYDSAERFQTETIFGRSIWQLSALSVK
jgi:hypothetical protein